MTRKAVVITGNCVSTKQRALLLKKKRSSHDAGWVLWCEGSFCSNKRSMEIVMHSKNYLFQ